MLTAPPFEAGPFAVLTIGILIIVLSLARVSQRLVTTAPRSPPATGADEDQSPPSDGPHRQWTGEDPPADVESVGVKSDGESPVGPTREFDAVALIVNVGLTHGLFGAVLVGGAILLSVPPGALGITSIGLVDVGLGIGLGVGLYGASELSATIADHGGMAPDESLRKFLAPESLGGWVLLVLVVLPIVAGFEELLFRGALVGVFALGFGVSPWALALVSSVLFGIGHGAQGTVGVVVTGLLGFGLAGAFILTGNVTTVIIAHYLVNVLEFLVHEGIGRRSLSVVPRSH